ncbi:MAG: hypothetical protein WCX12_02940 [Candidatus Paceibacterota bacterium]|jgi:hypothetical protein
MNITTTQARQRFKILPELLKEAVFSVQTSEIINQATEQNRVPPEKIGGVAEAVGLVLLGFIHPEEIQKEIQDRAGIDAPTAKAITDLVQSKIFSFVKNEIVEVYNPTPANIEPNAAKPKIISTSGVVPVAMEPQKTSGEIQNKPFILSSTHQTAGPVGGDDRQGPHSSFGPTQRSSISSVPDFHIQTRYSQAKIFPTTEAKDIEQKITQAQEQTPATSNKATSMPLPTERSEARVIMPVSGPKLEIAKPQTDPVVSPLSPIFQTPISGPSKIIDQVQKLEKFGGELVEILNRRKGIEDKKLGIDKPATSVPSPIQPQVEITPIIPNSRPLKTTPPLKDFSFQPPQPPAIPKQPAAAPVIIHQENQPAPIRASGSFKLQTLGQKSGDMIASSNKQTLPPIQKNFGDNIPSQGKPSGGWFRSLFGQKESNEKPATIVSFREEEQLKQETRRTLPPSPPLMKTVSLTNQMAPKITSRPPMPKAPVAPKAAGADIVLKTSATPTEKIIDLQTMKIKEVN